MLDLAKFFGLSLDLIALCIDLKMQFISFEILNIALHSCCIGLYVIVIFLLLSLVLFKLFLPFIVTINKKLLVLCNVGVVLIKFFDTYALFVEIVAEFLELVCVCS